MIKVEVFNKTKTAIDTTSLSKNISDFLKTKKVSKNSVVDVVVVGSDVMKSIAKIYLKEDPPSAHNVLSFVSSEIVGFVEIPDGLNRLGEIYICLPKAKEEARREKVSLSERIVFLAKHGVEHLLGNHHK